MSTLREILSINPPEPLVQSNQKETFIGKPIECNYCQGKGGFEKETKRNSSENEKEICPVCEGSGQIQAKIIVEWRKV